MRKLIEAAIICAGTLGFWGFVYPELCMAQETGAAGVCIVREKDREDSSDAERAAWSITGRNGETICMKSRLFEYILSEDMTE